VIAWCLGLHQSSVRIRDLDEAQAILDDRRQDCNEIRPHRSLGIAMPAEYAASLEDGCPTSSTGQAAACPTHSLDRQRWTGFAPLGRPENGVHVKGVNP